MFGGADEGREGVEVMCPENGEVLSLGFGNGGPTETVAMLSLTLNLTLTRVFIYFVKRPPWRASPLPGDDLREGWGGVRVFYGATLRIPFRPGQAARRTRRRSARTSHGLLGCR